MTTRTSSHAKTGRAVAAVLLFGAAVCLGVITVPSPPARAAQSDCLATAVNVTVRNRTSSPLSVNSTRMGVTNAWCALPGNPAGPNSDSSFEVGDGFFKTEVNVAYVAPNNDTIALQASSGYDGVESPEAHCVVVPNGHAPSPYRCSATLRTEDENRGALFGLASTRVTKVEWQIHGP